jgi:lipid-binding SYLF domain-containing protein
MKLTFHFRRPMLLRVLIFILSATAVLPATVRAASAAQINRNARAGLRELYASTPSARTVGQSAKAVLVFPSIIKGGFIVGAQGGEGALFSGGNGGKTLGYYSTVAASYGLQAGIQKFGYELFFMSDSALNYLNKSGGWELGTGPSLVIVDTGMAGSLTTTTLRKDVYAFFFNQKGLMAGLGLQGSKITRINPPRR